MEMAVRPVTARPVGTTPATTVSGAAADITKNTTEATPRRSRARAVESWLSLTGVDVLDTGISQRDGGVRLGGPSRRRRRRPLRGRRGAAASPASAGAAGRTGGRARGRRA